MDVTVHRTQAPEGGSLYTHPVTGERFWSVTTIIGGGLPKPALLPWAAKLVAEHAARSMRALAHGSGNGVCADCGTSNAAELVNHLKHLPIEARDTRRDEGSDLHKLIEIWQDTPIAAMKLSPLMGIWAEWRRQYRPSFMHNELTVINRTHGYAGTLDAILTLDGWDAHPWLVDWKTGKAIYADVGLQMAAYRHAEVILTRDGQELPMPEVAGAAVLRLDPDPAADEPYEFRKIDTGEDTFKAFLAAAEVYAFARRKDVLGPRIPTSEEIAAAHPADRATYFAMANAVP